VRFVTAQELSKSLKLTEATIYKLASDGELPGFKIGDSWRFDMDEIIKLIRGAKKKTKNSQKNRRTERTKEHSGVGQSHGAGGKGSGGDGQGDPAEGGQCREASFNLRDGECSG